MKRTSKEDTTLCLNFCVYYKPGKNEELMCRGFVVVQRLKSGRKRISLSRPEKIASADASGIDGLRRLLCAACEFREGDCDYVLTEGKAPSCGGFALLSHLLGSGQVTLEEIEEASR
jgi:hypothetical protein